MAVIKHVKKGDTVKVLSGKDAGRRGKVLRLFPSEGKVLVEGINLIKKHSRPTRDNPQGGVIEAPAPMPAAKVMVVCPKCNEPTRVSRKRTQAGEYVRVCKRCGAEIDR